MSKSNLHALSQPEATTNDPLHDLIRQGEFRAQGIKPEIDRTWSSFETIR